MLFCDQFKCEGGSDSVQLKKWECRWGLVIFIIIIILLHYQYHHLQLRFCILHLSPPSFKEEKRLICRDYLLVLAAKSQQNQAMCLHHFGILGNLTTPLLRLLSVILFGPLQASDWFNTNQQFLLNDYHVWVPCVLFFKCVSPFLGLIHEIYNMSFYLVISFCFNMPCRKPMLDFVSKNIYLNS